MISFEKIINKSVVISHTLSTEHGFTLLSMLI